MTHELLGDGEPLMRVSCPEHGMVTLSNEEYEKQMSNADAEWVCPKCGHRAEWVDFVGDEDDLAYNGGFMPTLDSGFPLATLLRLVKYNLDRAEHSLKQERPVDALERLAEATKVLDELKQRCQPEDAK